MQEREGFKVNQTIIDKLTKEELEILLKDLEPGAMLTIEMPETKKVSNPIKDANGRGDLADGGNV